MHFETVPAYNIVEDRLDKHPKANRWVGYLLELGGSTYYHAGDTDALPELESLTTQVAMVPIGGTYTMDAEEAGVFVRAMSPGLAVPMHYGFRVGSRGGRAGGRRNAHTDEPVRTAMTRAIRPTTTREGIR